MGFEHALLGFGPPLAQPPPPPLCEDASANKHHDDLLAALALDQVDALARALERSSMPLDAPLEWRGGNTSSQAAQGGGGQQRTLLGLAAHHGALNVLAALLAAGANPCAVSPADGFTPLHCACAGASSKTYEAIQLLLSAGADKDALDAFGRKPVDLLLCVVEAAQAGSSDGEVRIVCGRVSLASELIAKYLTPPSLRPTKSTNNNKQRPTACATWSNPSTAPTSFGCTASR
jgi:ankyrin repeat protein